MNLKLLGYNEMFAQAANDYPDKNVLPVRISNVNKNSFSVHNGEAEIYAELSGKFIYNIDSGLDLPTVGDWVLVSYFDQNSPAIIQCILPRQSVLKRKDPGKKLDYQLIAANIDYAFIMQDLNANFNLNRLERYLVMITESVIQPVILLSKSDLVTGDELDRIKTQLQRIGSKYQSLMFSNLTGDGLEGIRQFLKPASTYCLLGSSGVGKTTLLNKLLGEHKFQVKEVRIGDGKGRHSTTQRQLILLENGSLFIDTPGMRELGTTYVEKGIEHTIELC